MKATDLRIGNLLIFSNGIEPDREIVVGRRFFSHAALEKEDGDFQITPYYKGIPITEELIVNFGFKWKEETAHPFEKYWSNGIAAIDLLRQKFYIVRFKEGENHAEIKLPNYAHDLQNLHYALTKTELTLKDQ